MPKLDVAAYYFPNYHRDQRNDAWYGPGWTEWNLVRDARPRFPGHRQPIVPAWGEFDESDPAWAAREIDAAADHGLTAFIYDWYWYEDGPYLQDALERGFLRAPNRERMQFALMWANHTWTNIHPATFNNKAEAMAPGEVTRAAFERMTDHIVANLFPLPNHLRIDGCPYFSIYEIGRFISGLGGLDQALAALESFRAKTRAAGFPDLHLNIVVWGFAVLPGECTVRDPAAIAKRLGCASTTTYAWVHHYNPNSAGFPRGSWQAAADANYAAWDRYRAELGVPYHPNVSMGWDPSPRTIQSSPYANRGYPWTAVLEGNTPEAFGGALRRAKAFAESQGGHQLVTLNAWNEWTEGSYLLPDTVTGTAYLEQVRAVFAGRQAAARR
jgi:hypothetical protein